jgi:hypothetical protein
MILTAIFHMLSTGEVWNPSDLTQIDMPPEVREKALQKSLHPKFPTELAHTILR